MFEWSDNRFYQTNLWFDFSWDEYSDGPLKGSIYPKSININLLYLLYKV